MHRSPAWARHALVATVLVLPLVAASPAVAAPEFRAGASWLSSPGGSPVVTAAAASTVFAGSTSPAATPMTMSVRRSRVTQLAVQYDTQCFAYSSVLRASALRRATIRRDGRFKQSTATSLIDSDRVFWNGERYPDRIVETFKGRIVKGTARGTVRATLKFLDGSICTTGDQRWLMRHKRSRVFGGLTSQSMPVAVELSSSGSRINHLHVGWVASCSSQGVLVIPDFLTNFNLTNGAVDETFRQDFPLDEGGVVRYDYRLVARVRGAASTGTLNVTVSQIGTAGTVEESCTTPAVTWTARS